MNGPTHAHHSHEVTPLELFFDLVFVFAVSQLTHHLLENLHWRGLVETVVLLIGVFGVWSYTSFEATVIEQRRTHVTRMLLLVMMGGLFMNAAISHAFDQGAFAFVMPMLAIQLCRTLLVTLPAAPTSLLRQHYLRLIGWILISAPLWLFGAVVPSEERLWWWVAAAGVDLTGTWVAHPWPGRKLNSEDVPFDAGHMMERLRLFLLIALGEVIVASGAAIANAPPSPLGYVTGACAFVTLVALWALYFSGSDRFVSHHLGTTTNPILAARLAVNGEVLVVGGLIALAAAIEVVTVQPASPLAPVVALLIAGGPFAYLLVQAWYLRFLTGQLPRSRALTALALVPLGFAAPWLPAAMTLGLIALLLTVLWYLVERENQTAR